MKDKLTILLIAAGLGIAYIGIKSQNPILLGLIFVGLGLFSIFSGIRMIITRRANIPTSDSFDSNKERHTGLAAQLYGVLFIAFGMMIILIGLGQWLFPESRLFQPEYLLRNSLGIGILVSIVGALVMIFGMIRLIAGNAAYVETSLTPFERIAGGIYFSLFGFGILAVGIWFALSPSTFKAMINFVVSLLGKLIAG